MFLDMLEWYYTRPRALALTRILTLALTVALTLTLTLTLSLSLSLSVTLTLTLTRYYTTYGFEAQVHAWQQDHSPEANLVRHYWPAP